MIVERAASHSLADANPKAVVPKRVRPSVRHPFAPVAEYEGRMFAALTAQENLPEVKALSQKARLPRFSLLRGEVALLAERVWQISRGAA